MDTVYVDIRYPIFENKMSSEPVADAGEGGGTEVPLGSARGRVPPSVSQETTEGGGSTRRRGAEGVWQDDRRDRRVWLADVLHMPPSQFDECCNDEYRRIDGTPSFNQEAACAGADDEYASLLLYAHDGRCFGTLPVMSRAVVRGETCTA